MLRVTDMETPSLPNVWDVSFERIERNSLIPRFSVSVNDVKS